MPTESPDERFMLLETKIAYQEKLIAELNEVLLERGRLVDSMKDRLDNLERMVREALDERPRHERPPHY